MAATIASLVTSHAQDPARVHATIADAYRRIAEAADPAIFIHLRPEQDVHAEADRLMAAGAADRLLFGIPVAVKDNIDVAGLPTTAACSEFTYIATADATAVARLRAAGALVIGKTNLDQFATGLVGVRSPYGVPRNAMRADLVPGGSSSGSAVAVARGIVPLALGTDTAGSGRVPAGLNNIVGLKPSVGLVSATGVVPACRSLDCISIFSLTVEDAMTALSVMAGLDVQDGYSRALPVGRFSAPPPQPRIGIPRAKDRQFCGDARAAAAFDRAIGRTRGLGWSVVEIDLSPFLETARLLYDGAWVAERTAAVGEFIAKNPDAVHAVTKAIIAPGGKLSAVEAFRGYYRLADLTQKARAALAGLDGLLVPTAPTAYTLADLEADPIGPNSRLGTYTNFVNLLDMAGISVPSEILDDGTPVGVTLLGRAGEDARLAALGAAYHAATSLPLGALGMGRAPQPPPSDGVLEGEIEIVVVGAHLSGMPLNHELTALGARFVEATTTSADYRLYALAGTTPPKPGLLRVGAGTGATIAVETWALPAAGFGRFVDAIRPPLSIGTVRLRSGRAARGFLVEPEGLAGARDVTEHRGWRAAVAALAR